MAGSALAKKVGDAAHHPAARRRHRVGPCSRCKLVCASARHCALILTPTLTDTAIEPLYCANCCKTPNSSVKAAWDRTAHSTLPARRGFGMVDLQAHALTLLVHRCGWLALIALVTLLTALLVLAFRRCRRQKSMLARPFPIPCCCRSPRRRPPIFAATSR